MRSLRPDDIKPVSVRWIGLTTPRVRRATPRVAECDLSTLRTEVRGVRAVLSGPLQILGSCVNPGQDVVFGPRDDVSGRCGSRMIPESARLTHPIF